MSGIGCVGSSQGLSNLQLRILYSSTSTTGASSNIDDNRQQQMNARLDAALAQAGVDEETARAIETEMQQAFQASQDSGQFPSDPAAMKQTVDGIFAKYGLDASKIMGPPPQGGPPPQSQYDSTTDNDDATTALTKLLQQLADQGATPEELAQMFSDAITGLDQTV